MIQAPVIKPRVKNAKKPSVAPATPETISVIPENVPEVTPRSTLGSLFWSLVGALGGRKDARPAKHKQGT
jgi:hypothetical protein